MADREDIIDIELFLRTEGYEKEANKVVELNKKIEESDKRLLEIQQQVINLQNKPRSKTALNKLAEESKKLTASIEADFKKISDVTAPVFEKELEISKKAAAQVIDDEQKKAAAREASLNRGLAAAERLRKGEEKRRDDQAKEISLIGQLESKIKSLNDQISKEQNPATLRRLNKELQDTEKELKNTKSATSELDSVLGGITQSFGAETAAIGLATAAFAALVGITVKTFIASEQAAIAQGNLQKSTKVSADLAGALIAGLKTFGQTAEEASRDSVDALLQLGQAAQNDSKFFDVLNIKGAQLKSIEQIFREITKQAEETGLSQEKLVALSSLLGEDSAKKLLPLIDRFSQIEKQAKETGQTFSDVALKNFQDIKISVDQLTGKFEGLGNKFSSSLSETVLTIFQRLNDAFDDLSKNQAVVDTITDIVDRVKTFLSTEGPHLIELLSFIIGSVLPKLYQALKLTGIGIEFLVNPLGAAADALALLGFKTTETAQKQETANETVKQTIDVYEQATAALKNFIAEKDKDNKRTENQINVEKSLGDLRLEVTKQLLAQKRISEQQAADEIYKINKDLSDKRLQLADKEYGELAKFIINQKETLKKNFDEKKAQADREVDLASDLYVRLQTEYNHSETEKRKTLEQGLAVAKNQLAAAVANQIAIQNKYTEQVKIKDDELNIAKKKNLDSYVEAQKQVTEKIKIEQDKITQNYLNNLDIQLNKLEENLNDQLTVIDKLENAGTISHLDAVELRTQATRDFYDEEKKLLNESINSNKLGDQQKAEQRKKVTEIEKQQADKERGINKEKNDAILKDSKVAIDNLQSQQDKYITQQKQDVAEVIKAVEKGKLDEETAVRRILKINLEADQAIIFSKRQQLAELAKQKNTEQEQEKLKQELIVLEQRAQKESEGLRGRQNDVTNAVHATVQEAEKLIETFKDATTEAASFANSAAGIISKTAQTSALIAGQSVAVTRENIGQLLSDASAQVQDFSDNAAKQLGVLGPQLFFAARDAAQGELEVLQMINAEFARQDAAKIAIENARRVAEAQKAAYKDAFEAFADYEEQQGEIEEDRLRDINRLRKEKRAAKQDEIDDLIDLDNDFNKQQIEDKQQLEDQLAAIDEQAKEEAIERQRKFNDTIRDAQDDANNDLDELIAEGIDKRKQLEDKAKETAEAAAKDPLNKDKKKSAEDAAKELDDFNKKQNAREDLLKRKADAIEKARQESKTEEEFNRRKKQIEDDFAIEEKFLDDRQDLIDRNAVDELAALDKKIQDIKDRNKAAADADIADQIAKAEEDQKRRDDERAKIIDDFNQKRKDAYDAYQTARQDRQDAYDAEIDDLNKQIDKVNKKYDKQQEDLKKKFADTIAAIGERLAEANAYFDGFFQKIIAGIDASGNSISGLLAKVTAAFNALQQITGNANAAYNAPNPNQPGFNPNAPTVNNNPFTNQITRQDQNTPTEDDNSERNANNSQPNTTDKGTSQSAGNENKSNKGLATATGPIKRKNKGDNKDGKDKKGKGKKGVQGVDKIDRDNSDSGDISAGNAPDIEDKGPSSSGSSTANGGGVTVPFDFNPQYNGDVNIFLTDLKEIAKEMRQAVRQSSGEFFSVYQAFEDRIIEKIGRVLKRAGIQVT